MNIKEIKTKKVYRARIECSSHRPEVEATSRFSILVYCFSTGYDSDKFPYVEVFVVGQPENILFTLKPEQLTEL